MRVEIPLPPSSNRMYRKFRNMMVPCRDYLEWMRLAAPMVQEAWAESGGVEPPVQVHLTIYGGRGFPESSDADNCKKAVCDMLTPKEFSGKRYGAGILADDNVQIIRHESVTYFTRREHWDIKHPGTKPRVKDLDAIVARCFIEVVPHITVLPEGE